MRAEEGKTASAWKGCSERHIFKGELGRSKEASEGVEIQGDVGKSPQCLPQAALTFPVLALTALG